MQKKLLIIGGTGLLGINWALLQREKFEVVIGTNSRDIFINGVTQIRIDFEKVEQQIIESKADIVINAAGMTSVEMCEHQPDLAYKINVILSKKIAVAVNRCNTKLVQISTDHLFDGLESLVSEDCTPCPVNHYGLTKYFAEKEVAEACPSALIIRTNFFGWGPSYRKSFSDYILSNLSNKFNIGLFSDVYYTPILISDLVSATHALCERNKSGIFHVVGGERISKYQFGIELAKAFDLDATYITETSFLKRKDLVKRPLDMSLSNTKLISELSYSIGTIGQQLTKLKNERGFYFYKEIISL
jgi:dTDP-4-dehydrorhamnose reductase